jgi:hypothetical protein
MSFWGNFTWKASFYGTWDDQASGNLLGQQLPYEQRDRLDVRK